jgi:hypothetical protein
MPKWMVLVLIGALQVATVVQESLAEEYPLMKIGSEEIAGYLTKTVLANMKSKTVNGFQVIAMPATKQSLVTGSLSVWKQKRLTQTQIAAEVNTIDMALQKHIVVLLHISIVEKGDYKAKLKLPDDFKEFLFLENDTGGFVSATAAPLPMMRSLGAFNSQTSIEIKFPTKFGEDEQPLVTQNTKSLKMVVGGLSEAELTYTWTLPFAIPEPPASLKSIYDLGEKHLLDTPTSVAD